MNLEVTSRFESARSFVLIGSSTVNHGKCLEMDEINWSTTKLEAIELPTPGMLSQAYTGPVKRLFGSLHSRCEFFHLNPSFEEAICQLELRSLVLKKSSICTELYAMRQLTTLMHETKQEAKDRKLVVSPSMTVPSNAKTLLPNWFVRTGWNPLTVFSNELQKITRTQLIERGEAGSGVWLARLSALGFIGTREEMTRILAGVRPASKMQNVRRRPSLNWEPVTRGMLESMEAAMPPGTPEEGLQSLFSEKPCYGGITRFMARTAWLTGMRATEIFTCRLLAVKPDSSGSRTPLDGNIDNLYEGLLSGLLKDIEENEISQFTGTNNKQLSNPPAGPFLAVRTAKTRNASPLIKSPLRILRLDNIREDDLRCLWIASQLRWLPGDSGREKRVRNRCTSIIRKTSIELFPDRPDPITLHTLRHAFTHTARLTMRPDEVAALTGHTSVKTMRGYGGRYVRRKANAADGCWMPRPDPSRAAEIKQAWDLKQHTPSQDPPELDPEIDLEAALDPYLETNW